MFRLISVALLSLLSLHLAAAQSCQAGFDCVGQQVLPETSPQVTCTAGYYCPDGHSIDLCTKGYYCPTPSTRIPCPEGSWCPTGSSHPFECKPLSSCPAYSYKYYWFLLFILTLLTLLVLVLLHRFVYQRSRRLYAEANRSRMNLIPATPLQQSPSFLGAKSSLRLKVKVEFKGVSVDVPVGNTHKRVLHDITGRFRSGRLTAVMGPSGCGKTTFLNALANHVPIATGTIAVNGVTELHRLRRVLGFVPQEDVMLRMLTVHDVLLHSALTRLPQDWSHKEKADLVDDVIRVLDLIDVRDSIIGDENSRGISGGQLKRVNIGIELCCDPLILFLDEPTSGLDATAAKDVVRALQRVSMRGTMVITVIHQPRYEIFEMFDDVLLLGKGGHAVYLGPSKNAKVYFKSIGFEAPSIGNPSDFFSDVMCGRVPLRDVKGDSIMNSDTEKQVLELLFSSWQRFAGLSVAMQQSQLNSAIKSSSSSEQRQSSDNNLQPLVVLQSYEAKEESPDGRAPAEVSLTVVSASSVKDVEEMQFAFKRVPASWWSQFWLEFKRYFLMELRAPTTLLWDTLLMLLPGLALGFGSLTGEIYHAPLSLEMAQRCPEAIRKRCLDDAIVALNLPQSTFFNTMVLGAAATLYACRSFGMHKAVMKREREVGLNPGVAFLSRNLFDLIHVFRITIAYLGTYLMLSSMRGSFGEWFVVIFFLYFTAYGLAYFFSILTRYELATTIALVSGMAWSITAGFTPTLSQAEKWWPLTVLWYISYNRWSAEAIVLMGVRGQPAERIPETLASRGYNYDNFATDIGVTLCIGLGWRIVSFLLFWYKTRPLRSSEGQAEAKDVAPRASVELAKPSSASVSPGF